jgi:Family of unknown function (DUF5407)
MAGDGSYEGFKIDDLQGTIKDAEAVVIDKLASIKDKASDEINIGDMFDMQWMMNKFSQLSEMSSSVLSAAHQAVSSMNRNIK